ncbi:hypothetical protein [Streptomyces resistomycificus]|uniref:hypothetical protein n=1 Tax=Streptomyces resistomycificus TaxID=67356 RepID=UPI0012FE8D4A|nr:hypothetical protein [Streptomyces resistomycificus]
MTQGHRLAIAGEHHRQIYRLPTGQCPLPHDRSLRGGVCERAGEASDIGEIGEVGRQTGSGAGDDSDVSLPSAPSRWVGPGRPDATFRARRPGFESATI